LCGTKCAVTGGLKQTLVVRAKSEVWDKWYRYFLHVG